MLSPNDKQILAILRKGDYFGETGVFTTTKRMSSFVAGTFCIIYILRKDRLTKILKRFPRSEFDFKLFGNFIISVFIKKDQTNSTF